MLVQNLLQPLIQFLSLAEQIIERHFTEHRAKCRLRKLRGRIQIVLYVNDGPARVHHAEINDGIHLDADVIFSNDILGRYIHRDRAQADAYDAVDRKKDQDQSRPFRLRQQPPNSKNYSSLVLAQHVQRVEEPNQHKNDSEQQHWTQIHVRFLSVGIKPVRLRLLIRVL